MTIYSKYTSIYAGNCQRLVRKNLQPNIQKCKLLLLCKRGERGGFHKQEKVLNIHIHIFVFKYLSIYFLL